MIGRLRARQASLQDGTKKLPINGWLNMGPIHWTIMSDALTFPCNRSERTPHACFPPLNPTRRKPHASALRNHTSDRLAGGLSRLLRCGALAGPLRAHSRLLLSLPPAPASHLRRKAHLAARSAISRSTSQEGYYLMSLSAGLCDKVNF